MNKTEEELIWESFATAHITILNKFISYAKNDGNKLAAKYFEYILNGVKDDIEYNYNKQHSSGNLREELNKVDLTKGWKNVFDEIYDSDHPIKHIIELYYF